jgi:hypothetical protein
VGTEKPLGGFLGATKFKAATSTEDADFKIAKTSPVHLWMSCSLVNFSFFVCRFGDPPYFFIAVGRPNCPVAFGLLFADSREMNHAFISELPSPGPTRA